MGDPGTGLVRDRATAEESYAPGVASIAATGFGLSALAIGAARGYLEVGAAHARVRTTLSFLCERAEQKHGFFYHFLDSGSGKRIWKSELSSVDTGWLLCGVLHSYAFWDEPETRKLATKLLNAAEWDWMLDGSGALRHGWTPESGFLQYRWDNYSEALAMYLLAIGSQTHGIPPASWRAMKRPIRDFQGIFFIDAGAPLFVHQYSQAWFDFRDRRDEYANYYNNSIRATQAHKLFCLSYSRKYPWYTSDIWGVTASESRTGYKAWGCPSSPPDGTLVPCAAGGSLAFLPNECGAVLQNMFDQYGERIWSKYGFVDAFHPGQKWYSQYVLGIDLGIMLLMAENARKGSVWASMMSTEYAQRAFAQVGLRTYGA